MTTAFADEPKFLVRDRIIENKTYEEKLVQKESKLCWKLVFEPEKTAAGEIGFHIDILPSITYDAANLSILHPVKEEAGIYSWKCSNPEKFAQWFDSLNDFANKQQYYEEYRKQVFSALSDGYKDNPAMMNFSEAVEIPDTYIRTPLQRVVQLLKRNRDVFTANSERRIDSIIITRLAAGLYHGELTVIEAFSNIVTRLITYKRLFDDVNFSALKEFDNFFEEDLISRRWDSTKRAYIWIILNPCNPEENYAIRWHEDDNAQAKYFFAWLDQLESSFSFLKSQKLDKNGFIIIESMFGEKASKDFFAAYGERVRLLQEEGKLRISREGLTTKVGEVVKKHNFWG